MNILKKLKPLKCSFETRISIYFLIYYCQVMSIFMTDNQFLIFIKKTIRVSGFKSLHTITDMFYNVCVAIFIMSYIVNVEISVNICNVAIFLKTATLTPQSLKALSFYNLLQKLYNVITLSFCNLKLQRSSINSVLIVLFKGKQHAMKKKSTIISFVH